MGFLCSGQDDCSKYITVKTLQGIKFAQQNERIIIKKGEDVFAIGLILQERRISFGVLLNEEASVCLKGNEPMIVTYKDGTNSKLNNSFPSDCEGGYTVVFGQGSIEGLRALIEKEVKSIKFKTDKGEVIIELDDKQSSNLKSTFKCLATVEL
tara:strand:+ start:1580 stop:2038 length:459 start_codon:yes stop_codon:yes gene_type:complete